MSKENTIDCTSSSETNQGLSTPQLSPIKCHDEESSFFDSFSSSESSTDIYYENILSETFQCTFEFSKNICDDSPGSSENKK